MSLSPKLFYVELIVQQSYWAPGMLLIKNGDNLQKEFAEYIAEKYKEQLQKAINNQRFRAKWPPLSVEWLHYKQTHGLSLKCWEATGLLKRSIKVFPTLWGWAVGPDPHMRYKRSGVPVLAVARALEYGTRRIPPRPLFRPTAEYIRKHIKDYWTVFLRQKGLGQNPVAAPPKKVKQQDVNKVFVGKKEEGKAGEEVKK